MQIWVASRNRHKLEEIGAILGATAELRSLLDRPDIPDVEENGATYLDNARLKAHAIWEKVREPVLADDSGLEVDALGGRPGVHSARYSAPDPTAAKNIVKLLGELGDLPLEKRSARFRCTVVFLDATGTEHVFVGIFEGLIGFVLQGQGGFGFDPVFFLPGRNCTVAELPEAEKNAISHRGGAFRQFRAHLGL